MKDNEIDEPVQVVSYDFRWPIFFLKEKKHLLKLDADIIDIEHIGSTAIPGLKAKPIVDMMIGIEHYPPSSELIFKLGLIGYTSYGEAGVPGRTYLIKRGEINFNIAIVYFNGDHWKANLKFREYLLHHIEVCHQYEAIKLAAVASGANRLLTYSHFKSDFLKNILNRMDGS